MIALTPVSNIVIGSEIDPSTQAPAEKKVVEFPNVRVDLEQKNIRVDCEILAVDMALEFYLVAKGGPDHESVLRTAAKPSSIHAGLIMLGIEPGSPARYSETTRQSIAPFGPPLRLKVEWEGEDGKLHSMPAESLIRSIKEKKPMPQGVFIFTGSKQRDDGAYMADLAGYVVSIVNFDLTPIDVPRVASSANETLEWEYNTDVG
ncbi:MAG TPA: YdjY domain-containing protein, partial [Tepidisphaeraceae bacterium]|nr:YdjY domain-containing protein [Tepidisphaeraceae bacterium]